MERLKENIVLAILPIYKKDIGDCSKVIIHNGDSLVLNFKINTVIKSLAKYYMLNLEEIKKEYSKIIGFKNLVPIPFDESNIFIPIKTRLPKFKNDKAFAYVNLNFIEGIEDFHPYTNILLKNGKTIKSLSSINTVKKHISNGNIVKNCYIKRTMPVWEDDIKYDYLIPATRKDLLKFMEFVQSLKHN